MRQARVSALVPILLLAQAAMAHEIGTTRVNAQFLDAGTYEIEIATDATALAEKLESVQGRALSPTADLKQLIAAADPLFRQRVELAFDGIPAHPDFAYEVEPADKEGSVPGAMIRLTGKLPNAARTFTWRFGWTFAAYSLSLGPETYWIEGSDASPQLALTPQARNRLHVWRRYLALGFTHILPYGLDHVLFVLGIYLLNHRLKAVLLQVSAFTVAHSVTLGLSMYGAIRAPSQWVEPLIALSIVYVAVENIFLSELKPWRIGLVFAFGLLHGMGFAGVLQELGLPRSDFFGALLSFNLGVEFGQLAVVSLGFLLVGWKWGGRDWYRSRVAIPASLLIACTALYWTVERIA